MPRGRICAPPPPGAEPTREVSFEGKAQLGSAGVPSWGEWNLFGRQAAFRCSYRRPGSFGTGNRCPDSTWKAEPGRVPGRRAQAQHIMISVTYFTPWLSAGSSDRRKVLPRPCNVATLVLMSLETLPNAFSHSLAQERGLSDRRLRGLLADGALERLAHGLYRKANAPPADLDRIEIALRASDATLCLTTALSHHDLTDVIPSEIDVALPRSRRPPRVRAPVRWHRFHEETFDVGRETIEVDERLSIGIFSAERSLMDAFRLRHQEGEEMAVVALRRWLERPGATPAKLLAMARHFPKAEPSLLQTLRILS